MSNLAAGGGQQATERNAGASLAWKLNRLRCMTPAEIGYRLSKAVAMRAERLGFVPCVVPLPDLSRRARPWIHVDARVEVAPYVAAAERVLAGRFDVFALEDVELGNPPQWNRDPKTGVVAPMGFGKQIDYRDARVVGDCKYLWEPNRHLHLVTLAQAYALTGEEKYAATVRKHLESWFDANPFRMGPHWSSSLELGLRLINWALAWQLLGGVEAPLFRGAEGEAFRARWLQSVFQHAEFIAGHFSLHSSANNHLIGEVAGLYTAAVAWPHWERCRAWRDRAREILEREALLQNAPDGVNREQAVSYQQFTFDLLLFPMLAGEANADPFPAEYRKTLERMLEFLASIIDVGGNVPMVGDADDAHVALLDPRPGFDRYRASLAAGALLFGRGEFKAKAGGLDDKARWLLGPLSNTHYQALASPARGPIRREFREGGYCVLGRDFDTPQEVRLLVDVGPLGYREIAAHGHADALSFTLSLGGVELLVDPGTFAYHTETEWRSYFRGTSAHNTVRIDGLDQSEQGGNFMWLRKARAERLDYRSNDHEDVVEGRHDGYTRLPDPVVHRRRIALDKRAGVITIVDALEMKGEHSVEIFFHCAEGTEVVPAEGGVRLRRLGRTLELRWPDHPGAATEILSGSTAPIAGWISRRFDRKEPIPTLCWRVRAAGPLQVTTELRV